MGILHFYGKASFRITSNYSCVNSLLRVSYISTVRKNLHAGWKAVCQFPSTGILHFYHRKHKHDTNSRGCVNSLLRVSYISTVILFLLFEISICVNSLLRVSYISTLIRYYVNDKAVMCQFPSTGILHFYGRG